MRLGEIMEDFVSDVMEFLFDFEGYKDLWFSYAGHGYHIHDRSGDEKDKRDECIIPIDFRNGVITDDFIHRRINSQLSEDTKLIAFMDCCHSGTIFDLKYNYKNEKESIVENDFDIKANIIAISGCTDTQESTDIQYNNGERGGVMTMSLLKLLKQFNYNISYSDLLPYLRKLIRREGVYNQTPQISSTIKINKNTMFG